jgi:type IV secretory pathway VirJ component
MQLLSKEVAFEFHLSNRLSDAGQSDALPVAPEIVKLKWVECVCPYGAKESDSACPGPDKNGVTKKRYCRTIIVSAVIVKD